MPDYETTSVEAAARHAAYHAPGDDPREEPSAEDLELIEKDRQRQRRMQAAE